MQKNHSEFDVFADRHIGPSRDEIAEMLSAIGAASLDRLTQETVPETIRLDRPVQLEDPMTEAEVLQAARRLASKNRVCRSYLGQGYSNCIMPPVIQRNILENPGWYTQYTPYQAEISQGRLEALLNFQTMVSDLTALPIANASLLDEATAAAEAMSMAYHLRGSEDRNRIFVADHCYQQTIDVIRTRAAAIGIDVDVEEAAAWSPDGGHFAVLIQYPDTEGGIADHSRWARRVQDAGALVIVATDLLALTLLAPPGEWGADIAVGNSQRFGVPLGFGGPHAAFFATKEEFKRHLPGRIVGVSRDADGRTALRLSLQTREQHIRREKATSNICTAQVLLAVMAGMYAVYHGPEGLSRIGSRVHGLTRRLAAGLRKLGFNLRRDSFFDTLRTDLSTEQLAAITRRAYAASINLRRYPDGLGISLDETTKTRDVIDLLLVFSGRDELPFDLESIQDQAPEIPVPLRRQSSFLEHPAFHRYRSETELLRYIHYLQGRDLSLTSSMIPLGSCTMKLNAAAEMLPLTWPGFADIHPFAPLSQAEGYLELIRELEAMLCELTGFHAVSLQPNAGSQGEYAGLLTIRSYHASRGDKHRRICLIPESAHGTNPASAVMAGLKVVVVACDDHGNIDVDDLRAKLAERGDEVAALMITYPSTHGVFEEAIREIIDAVHEAGGQVYLDGANLNAQLCLCRPADYGADVCHLNLHKTFCIPHGGGGPGVGPIGVADHLAPFLPSHFAAPVGGKQSLGPVAAAPWGSALILLISWAYIKMMGTSGLKKATEIAILNANYIADRLQEHFPVLYRGAHGRVAHECILDLRRFKREIGIAVVDVAKRLADYGFHAPTVSFPVVETLMVEPTESESKEELDRFCEAMIAIRQEIRDVEEGRFAVEESPLKNAPHTAEMVTADAWERPYTRRQAAFPTESTLRAKFWPPVRRIDEVYGDRNLFCVCPPVSEYGEE